MYQIFITSNFEFLTLYSLHLQNGVNAVIFNALMLPAW